MANVIRQVVGNNKPNRIARDSDGDGVMDIIDCEPHNKHKQGIIHTIGAAVVRKLGNEERADRIEERGRERDEEKREVRTERRQERKDFKAAERESFREERVIVAKKRGVERARQPSGFAALSAGVQKLASKVPKQSKGKARKATGPTMADLLGGTKKKGKSQSSMFNIKF